MDHLLLSHGPLASWRQWVVKHFRVQLQSPIGAWFLFHSETIISQAVTGFVLCSRQLFLTLAGPTAKRNLQYLQKNLHSHSSLLFQMLAAFLNPSVTVDGSLLVKASGGSHKVSFVSLPFLSGFTLVYLWSEAGFHSHNLFCSVASYRV